MIVVELKSGSRKVFRVGAGFAGTNRFASTGDTRSDDAYQDGTSHFLSAGVAAGRSAHRRHQFLEAHPVQHPFEVVSQGRQAPLALHLGQAFEQKVRVAEPPLDRPGRMLGQCLS